ncbi:hypothetical protein [Herbiconiux daphne]|uniref:Uncharacterized protein n=1 Tax=Herbiconiux daphne TaxID=2970914 RepID=A0ABT2GY80_9MICO|nr:hypothetical protein [Herbiconiux daphne]MCS5732892.1 hypothetical protein [Herbiconiux daphne]
MIDAIASGVIMGDVATRICASLIIAAGAILLSSCSTPDVTPAAVDKYTQTWTASYSETTCDDWLNVMTPAQQFAGAADILTAARNKIDGGTGLPSDSLIDEFAEGINNVCVIPTMTLTDATYGLYTTEPRFHP